jgi:hypothetical protein
MRLAHDDGKVNISLSLAEWALLISLFSGSVLWVGRTEWRIASLEREHHRMSHVVYGPAEEGK